jgi:predicted RNA-binding Zn-ribbon protein involved in translation (DUF1610 family)
MSSGQSVTINGLINSSWLNCSEGEIALFDADKGRYRVRVLAPRDAVQRCNGMALVRPENLFAKGAVSEALEYGSEWRDEYGVVFKKNTEFGRLCPRSHVLVVLDRSSALCSVCGETTVGAMWNCQERCNYYVCDTCHLLLEERRLHPLRPPQDAVQSTDGTFPMKVSLPFVRLNVCWIADCT